MVALTLEPETMTPMTLEPRVERSGGAIPPLHGRVSLGGPFVIPLDADTLRSDEELCAFIRGDTDAEFFLMHMTATFEPDDEEPLERVWFAVNLGRGDGVDSPLPVAWSMKPDREYEEQQRSSRLRLGPSLKLVAVGVSAAAERGSSYLVRDVMLEARYEKQSNPTWVLERTRGSAIRGVQRFALVVRSPRAARGRGSVEIGAVIRRKRFGPITHRVPLHSAGPLQFVLTRSSGLR